MKEKTRRRKSNLYSFREAEENISVTLHKSNLTSNENKGIIGNNSDDNNNSTYYGHITRHVADIKNVIAELGEKNTGVSQSTMYHVASLLKEGILEYLGRGFAINMFDIGTVYITIKGKITKTMTESEIAKKLTLDFSPAKDCKTFLKNIVIKNVNDYESPAMINTVKNHWDKEAGNNTVTIGRVGEVTGSKIKMGESDSGLYFIKVLEDGSLSKNNDDRILCNHIIKNSQNSIMFYVPEELSTDNKYIIAIETNLSISGKTANTKNIIKSGLITVL